MSNQALPLTSLDKAIHTLLALGEEGNGATVTSLNRRLGYGKSTIHRMLAILLRHRLLAQDPATRRYYLGLGVMELAERFSRQNILLRLGLPYLEELERKTGETVVLSVREGQEVAYLAKQESRGPIKISVELKRRIPAHASAGGKVLLAELSDSELVALYGETPVLPQVTSRTIRTMDALRAELRRVRRQEYACSREESYPGYFAVAAPVRDREGRAIAAISLAGNAALHRRERLQEVIPVLKAIGRALSREIGYKASPQAGGGGPGAWPQAVGGLGGWGTGI